MSTRAESIALLREALELAEKEEAEGVELSAETGAAVPLRFNPGAVSPAAAGLVHHYLNRIGAQRQVAMIRRQSTGSPSVAIVP